MRSLWIGGIVLLALVGAGCSSGSSSPTTTVKHRAATSTTKGAKGSTSTTVSKGPLTPTSEDKAACAAYASAKATPGADTKATAAQIRATLKALKNASYKPLHNYAKEWAGAIVGKHPSKAKAKKAEKRITRICARMGLG